MKPKNLIEAIQNALATFKGAADGERMDLHIARHVGEYLAQRFGEKYAETFEEEKSEEDFRQKILETLKPKGLAMLGALKWPDFWIAGLIIDGSIRVLHNSEGAEDFTEIFGEVGPHLAEKYIFAKDEGSFICSLDQENLMKLAKAAFEQEVVPTFQQMFALINEQRREKAQEEAK